MLFEEERNALLKENTRTQAHMQLYTKYYNLLYRFAEDLRNSSIKQIILEENTLKIISREGIVLECPEGDTGVLGEWLILPDYEKHEQEVMIHLLTLLEQKGNNQVFFDIGANVGWYSLLFSKLFKSLHIHSFEPSKTTFNQLLNNIKINKSERIKTNNIGLADTSGEKEFFICDNMLGASSLADTIKNIKKTKVVCRFETLDEYCIKNNTYPDFIKCDVEGAEFLVLKGAQKTFEKAKPAIMVELLRKWTKCFSYHPNDVINHMKELGYLCYVNEKNRLRVFKEVTEDTIETNYFFLHSEQHAEIINKLAGNKI